jgi:hypothetical protein
MDIERDWQFAYYTIIATAILRKTIAGGGLFLPYNFFLKYHQKD